MSRLRNRLSYQVMVSGLWYFHRPDGYNGGMCRKAPKLSTQMGPCTFAIEPFGWDHEIRFSLTVDSHSLILAASPESCAILRRRFGTPNTDRYVADPGPLIPWHRRSPMTRKLTRNVLCGIAPFIAVLTIMIALAALGQRTS